MIGISKLESKLLHIRTASFVMTNQKAVPELESHERFCTILCGVTLTEKENKPHVPSPCLMIKPLNTSHVVRWRLSIC